MAPHKSALRIGMISPYSLTAPGGVQNQILALGRALRARGESVRVLAPCDGPPPESFVTPLGNSVPTGANGSIVPLAPDPAAQLRTIRALRDEQFDILHVHEPMAPGPTMTAMLVKPAPIVATFHSAGSSVAYDFFKPLTSRGSSRMDLRFAVSEDAEQLAKHSLGGEYERAFNGVEIDRFRAVPKRSPSAPTILFLARHEERKGLAVLLEAFARMEGPLVLWVGGVGPETAALREQYRTDTRIQWLGEIGDTEKVARMRHCDVFCAPSIRGESFGIVLLEAMAAETAVVASDLSGYTNVIRDAGEPDAGLLVPVGDSNALGAALASVLADAPLRKQLIERGSERVEDFSMNALADLYLDSYRRVLSQGRPANLLRPGAVPKTSSPIMRTPRTLPRSSFARSLLPRSLR